MPTTRVKKKIMVIKQWQKYCLAFKCRCKWTRRRKTPFIQDELAMSFYDRCEKLHKLKTYLEK